MAGKTTTAGSYLITSPTRRISYADKNPGVSLLMSEYAASIRGYDLI